MKIILRFLLRVLYRFRAHNSGALDVPGPVVLVANHSSWWDWLLLGVCLDNDWRFVTSVNAAEVSWVHKRIMINRRTFPVDMHSPFAVKHMAEYLQGGGRLVLFPEGRLSVTGSLMKLFDGTGFLLWKTRPRVIVSYIRGALRLPYSPNPNRKRWFPKLSAHFADAVRPEHIEGENAHEGRARLTLWLHDRMLRQRLETEMEFGPPTIPEAILDAARRFPRRIVLEDITQQRVNYRRLRIGANLLAARWRERLDEKETRVGVLLPNVNAMPVVLQSLWLAQRVPAILNYSSGSAVMAECGRIAGLKQVISSRAFVERGHLHLAPLEDAGLEIIYLEDIRQEISGMRKALAAAKERFGLLRERIACAAGDAAVILFTSGSEGVPKGVELTHRNLLANARQMLSVIDLMETDRFFNSLPLFHSFGLTVGLLLPLVEGVYTFLYPSPLHYRVVPSALYNLDCTIFFGTNTFLAGYGRKADPFDFRSVRYLFAGAEKVQDSTSTLWMSKFGVRILEGYGATECSPCVSVNTPLHPQRGSAGRFLPGIEYRLEPVEDLPEAGGANGKTPGSVGRLFVRGPNIMRGYVNAEANARFRAMDGWYDTGDVVRVDSQGFIYILGRLKRFAKVSGEMVSLAAVEEALSGAFERYGPKTAVAVVARPDAAKGEKLIAVTNEPKVTLPEIRELVHARGLGNLAVPKEIRVVKDIPLLGTGKIDLRALDKLVS
jgi:acyl-[acyl-carrier-protein]-phospholipid O-acyltransferase/long-chain-fatty-acid--[acyl-carrier-protein] ligase